ncbi:MAG: hybrid sensor histidine kinase/response regulator [Desulfosoma sp.]|uniref:hybrid sensor histidine kinase/response regulator n=1 Tax=Desulfosoma sp. TaxID=2603217 RepID=UPI00404B68DC
MADQYLNAESRLFHEIFQHVSTGIAVYEAVDEGKDFVFKDINPAGTSIGKMPREAYIGRRLTEVYPCVRETGLLEVLQRVWKTGVPEKFAVTRYRDERIELWVENYVTRLPSGENLTVFEDLTARKQTEAEKAQLLKQIHRVQKMEALAALAAGIAHDFNNLLMPILGYAQMGARRSASEEPHHRYFMRILDASRRAKDLVGQILLLSRDNPSAEKGADLVPILKECVKLLRAGVPEFLEISYEKLPQTAPVPADPVELHQIVMNLGVNAYQAVGKKSGWVRFQLECPCETAHFLRKVSDAPTPWVRLSVLDSGPGVSPEVREKIFEPYFSTKKPEEGTGLGLFIVSGVVQRLGGAVWVEDAPQGGAAFHVLLPMAPAAAPTEVETLVEDIPSLDAHLLIVDDDPVVRSILKTYLTPCVRRLTLCETPREALEIFQAHPEDFDIVLTDYSMPGCSGFELVQCFKEQRPSLPVILLTGYCSLENMPHWHNVHLVDRVLYKPISRMELCTVLQEVLQAR